MAYSDIDEFKLLILDQEKYIDPRPPRNGVHTFTTDCMDDNLEYFMPPKRTLVERAEEEEKRRKAEQDKKQELEE